MRAYYLVNSFIVVFAILIIALFMLSLTRHSSSIQTIDESIVYEEAIKILDNPGLGCSLLGTRKEACIDYYKAKVYNEAGPYIDYSADINLSLSNEEIVIHESLRKTNKSIGIAIPVRVMTSPQEYRLGLLVIKKYY